MERNKERAGVTLADAVQRTPGRRALDRREENGVTNRLMGRKVGKRSKKNGTPISLGVTLKTREEFS